MMQALSLATVQNELNNHPSPALTIIHHTAPLHSSYEPKQTSKPDKSSGYRTPNSHNSNLPIKEQNKHPALSPQVPKDIRFTPLLQVRHIHTPLSRI